MRLRTKIVLLAVLPLVAALALIALAVRHQERDLARREHALVQQAYMDARRAELRHYVALAASTVRPLHQVRPSGEAERRQAIELLRSLDYGTDGYFFVYDLQGTVLMHSRQPELVGRNLWELRDPRGEPTIQRLIAAARAGGGFVDYLWRKPSTGQMAPKLGYVIALEDWNWMMGTGLYLDDIRSTMDRLDTAVSENVQDTLLWIAGIAVAAGLFISACGLLLNLSEYRVADAKLRLMARRVVQSQEDERAHLSRELHDGTSQALVAAKLMVESALHEVEQGRPASPATLQHALERLNGTLVEVRRLSQHLRPALLDTLGLTAALEHLAGEFEAGGQFEVRLDVGAGAAPAGADWPEAVKIALFRVAQEALTNAAKHAGARRVEIALGGTPGEGLHLRVSDDGRGFDEQAVQLDPRIGLGLRNMRERLESIGGQLQVESRPGHGTQVDAWVPASALA